MNRLTSAFVLVHIMLAQSLIVTALLLTGPVLAGTCDDVFTAAFQPGQRLLLDIRPANVDIYGTTEAEVRVVCQLESPTQAGDVRITLGARRLRIDGGPHQGVSLRVYVPRHTHLDLDCTAGNVTVHDVDGDKELRLRAGNLIVEGVDPADYSRVDVSVTAGNVRAVKFRAEKSGLFRSFSRHNSRGKYRLNAKVSAGNVTIR